MWTGTTAYIHHNQQIFPRARYTLPGVMMVWQSDARIQSIAALMSRSEIFWQWQTIMKSNLVAFVSAPILAALFIPYYYSLK
ncbi:MAG: hypothetical protein ACI92Z_000730 [Paracoccaceae bacterium]|jgi:hypothetical protein